MASDLFERVRQVIGVDGPWLDGTDEVCKPLIRHWCEAMQDTNPLYIDEEYAANSKYGGIIAPPTMLLSWSMPRLWPPVVPPEGPVDRALEMLNEAGFTQLIVAGSTQKYMKPLVPGDRVKFTYVVDDVSEERQTPLGTGYFVNALFTYVNQKGEVVGTQTLRILKYRPGS